jgi:rubredoxin
MNPHQYILEPYKGINTRYHCPQCQYREKTFVLYVDTETMQHVHQTVGRCNRESKCGYHYTPKQYFQDNNISKEKHFTPRVNWEPIKQKSKPISIIPVETFKASLKGYETNHFVTFLKSKFGLEIANKLISKYFIATSKHWCGANIFWQIDRNGKIRTGKIMLYNPESGKRIKEPYNHIYWVHKALKCTDYELKQCLFGEHLLIDTSKTVAIVESEKTAIVASIYLPQFVWLATGSLSNLNVEKCSVLKDRTVILFPDLNGYSKWKDKSLEIASIAKVHVSDLLECKASVNERKQGLDIADYILEADYSEVLLNEDLNRKTSNFPVLNTKTHNPNSIKTVGQLFDYIYKYCPTILERHTAKIGLFNIT